MDRGRGGRGNRSNFSQRGGRGRPPPRKYERDVRDIKYPPRAELNVPKSDVVCGVKGTKTVVEANYFTFKIRDVQKCFHYDVDIVQPETAQNQKRFKKLYSKVMEQFRQKYYNDCYPVFDGTKNLYASKLSNSDYRGEVLINRSGSNPLKFNVTLKYVKEVDLTPLHNYKSCIDLRNLQEVYQFVSVLLRSSPLLNYISVGRNFYCPPAGAPIDLSCGMELYYGFHQTPMLAQRGPMINVDVAHKAFLSSKNLLELIKDICCLREIPEYLNEYQIETVINVLKGKRVMYKVGSFERDYTINGFKRSPKMETIPESLTILDYFAKKKQYRIKHANFQLLWVGDEKKDPPILIPPELCTLKPGQTSSTIENPKVTSNMIRRTATSVHERKNKILNNIALANYHNNPYFEEFGFSVNNQFELVNARILDPPKLKYSSDVFPKRGQWDIRGKQFLKPCTISKWGVVNLDRYVNAQKIKELEKEIIKQAEFVGVKMQPAENFKNLNPNRAQIQKIFEEKKNYDLIIVIIPVKFQQNENLYSIVKQEAEINIGCLTQCISSKTIERSIAQSVISNILLKINSKLNGINHKLAEKPAFLKGNVMLMGADVTHPKKASNKPSFAAVTASQDHDFFQYKSLCQLQPPTKELICKLELITQVQLQNFYKNTRTKPDHIIYIRDGVSEGYFEEMKNIELRAIKNACLNIDGNYRPKITFIVVLKRHHTRFFPTEPTDDRNGNIPAGTCVDTDITHPISLNLKHYFLASHVAIQGVTRPAKYCTIHDDANLSYDNLEELSYYLCHMYCRCTRAVSYPAPTYYAHLAAERAKYLYEGKNIDEEKLVNDGRIAVVTKMERSPMCFV